MLKVVYYIFAAIFGFFFSMVVAGSSMATFHYLDGRLVEDRMTDASFLMDHATRLQTKTVIDYDGLISIFSGGPIDILPQFEFKGDFGTPNSIYLSLLVINIGFILLLAWAARRTYFAARLRRSPERR